ncbi:MAG: hypothetical protein ACWA5R_12940 [bacterium]
MTLIVLALALFSAHYLSREGRYSQQFVKKYNRWFLNNYPGEKELSNLVTLITWLLIPAALLFITLYIFEHNLHFWVSIPIQALLMYLAIGPQDLDTDVDRVLHAQKSERKDIALNYFGISATEDHSDQLWPILVTREALQRWFTPIFCFVVLGPVTALIYRLIQITTRGKDPEDLATKVRLFMEWLPAQLMVLSLAVVDNFLPVIQRWKGQRCPETGKIRDIECQFLYQAISTAVDDALKLAKQDETLVDSEEVISRLRLSRQLIWRILGVWMTLIALLILLNLIP